MECGDGRKEGWKEGMREGIGSSVGVNGSVCRQRRLWWKTDRVNVYGSLFNLSELLPISLQSSFGHVVGNGVVFPSLSQTVSRLHVQKPKRVVPVIKLPDDLAVEIQRHRRQHQGRLDPRNRIKRARRPALDEPNGQEFARPEAEEVPQHDRKHGRLDTDVAMGVEQVCKRIRLLCHGGKDHHSVDETHHHPIDRVAGSGGAGVPAEEREARDPDEEAEGDEVEAELGLVDAVVAAGGVFGGAVGEGAHDAESNDGANGGEGVQVAELGRGVGDGRGREYLRDNDGESNKLLGGLISDWR